MSFGAGGAAWVLLIWAIPFLIVAVREFRNLRNPPMNLILAAKQSRKEYAELFGAEGKMYGTSVSERIRWWCFFLFSAIYGPIMLYASRETGLTVDFTIMWLSIYPTVWFVRFIRILFVFNKNTPKA